MRGNASSRRTRWNPWTWAGGLLVGGLGLGGPATADCYRVEICHVPPGGPGVLHTITVCEELLSKHLAHGDLEGECSALGEALCDDADPCTVDGFDASASGTPRCVADPLPGRSPRSLRPQP